MGTLNSIHTKLTDFSEEANEVMDTNYSTPRNSLRNKHLLNIDPRSPTENIDRTPIIVDGTPICHSIKGTASVVASGHDGPMDPRSPSTEFTRTPLSLSQTPSSTDFNTPVKAYSELRLPSVSQSDDELSEGNYEKTSDMISAIEGEDTNDLNETASSHGGDADTADESLEEFVDTAPLLEGTRNIELSSSQHFKKSGSSDSDLDSDHSPSLNKPRCQQIHRILGQKSSSNTKSRSPLSVVDNSPRVSLSLKKSSSLTGKNETYISSKTIIDKENVYH